MSVKILKMVKYIEPEELAGKIRDGNDKLLVVDVRDHDFEVTRIFKLFFT